LSEIDLCILNKNYVDDTMGGDLGGDWGTTPKFEVGHPSTPIFREVVLLDVCESTNRVKKVVMKECFVVK